MALKNPELVHLGKYFSSMFMSVCELLLRSKKLQYSVICKALLLLVFMKFKHFLFSLHIGKLAKQQE